MPFRDWFVDRFLGEQLSARAETLAETRVQEKLVALREATGRQVDDGFRRLTDSERDLPGISIDRQREVAVYLWTVNPLARRIVNAIVEWVVGEGVQIQASHPKTQELIDRHWKDPINRWDMRMEEKVRELYLMGEQFWPGVTNEYSGIIRLGVLDPQRVKEVVLDPDNALIPIGVVTKQRPGVPERRYRTFIRSIERDMLSDVAHAERERMTAGEVFVNSVNKLSTASRGVSEIFALADWLEGYETMLFGAMQQDRIRNQFIYDITLEGADDAAIEKRLKELKSPKPLSIRIHNEKEKWNIVGPDLGAASANTENARLARNHVLGGGAIPEHWYGGGGDVNRASAAEMGAPTEKAFTARQKTVRYMMEELLGVQVDRAIEIGAIPDDDEARDITVTLPELSARDLSRVGPALQQITFGLQAAAGEGWVDGETATKILASVIAHTGVEVDAAEMLERAGTQLMDRLKHAEERRRVPMPPIPTELTA